jgi:hypothetical protein
VESGRSLTPVGPKSQGVWASRSDLTLPGGTRGVRNRGNGDCTGKRGRGEAE